MPIKGDYPQTVLKTSLKYRFLGHTPYPLNQNSQKKYKWPRHRCICKTPKELLLIVQVWKSLLKRKAHTAKSGKYGSPLPQCPAEGTSPLTCEHLW